MTNKPIGFWGNHRAIHFIDFHDSLGLVMEPGKMYSQEVPVSFKITMATLGPECYKEGVKTGRSIIMLTHQKDGEFALCSLSPEKHDQQPLDIVFLVGETIHLRVVGDSSVHLTGYYVDDVEDGCDGGYDSEELEAEMNGEDIDISEDDEEDEEEEEEEEDREVDSELESEEDEDEYDDEDSFIDDSEIEEEITDSECSEDEHHHHHHHKRPSSRIYEVTSEEEEEEEEDEEEEEEEEDSETETDKNSNKITRKINESEEAITSNKKEKATQQPSEPKKAKVENSKENKNAPQISKSNETAEKMKKTANENKKEVSSNVETPKSEKKTTDQKQQPSTPAGYKPVIKTLPSGLQIEDLKVGAGIKAQKGRRVEISYTVTGDNGKVLNSTKEPLNFELGDTKVLKAINTGIQGMALGGERKLVVPHTLVDEGTLPKANTYTINVKLEKVISTGKTQ